GLSPKRCGAAARSRRLQIPRIRNVAGALPSLLRPLMTANLSTITCIEDLRVVAQKRVPRMFYDYADSGAWTEGTYRANESDFHKIKLRQRVAVNMEGRSLRTTMVGHDVVMPLAISPTGLTGMQHADGEILAAKAAADFGVPFTL